MGCLKPPFAYYGGKVRISQWIIGWWSAEVDVNAQSVNRRRGEAIRRTEQIWSNVDLESGRLPLWG